MDLSTAYDGGPSWGVALMIRRLASLAVLTLSVLCLPMGIASADPSPVTSPIQAGNNHTTVGSATFTRSANGDGTETLTVQLSVPGGIAQDHLCLSDTAFTSRVSPGQCPYAHESLNGATSDTFTVNVGTAYLGKTIYAQLHVATTDGQTAFAGWQAGNPFYGNVAIDALPVAGAPAAPLLGRWMPLGLGVLFVAGMGAVVWRRRRPAFVTGRG